jgi:hypothetical protein
MVIRRPGCRVDGFLGRGEPVRLPRLDRRKGPPARVLFERTCGAGQPNGLLRVAFHRHTPMGAGCASLADPQRRIVQTMQRGNQLQAVRCRERPPRWRNALEFGGERRPVFWATFCATSSPFRWAMKWSTASMPDVIPAGVM